MAECVSLYYQRQQGCLKHLGTAAGFEPTRRATAKRRCNQLRHRAIHTYIIYTWSWSHKFADFLKYVTLSVPRLSSLDPDISKAKYHWNKCNPWKTCWELETFCRRPSNKICTQEMVLPKIALANPSQGWDQKGFISLKCSLARNISMQLSLRKLLTGQPSL